VHAAVLSSGYRLVAVGEQAQLEGEQCLQERGSHMKRTQQHSKSGLSEQALWQCKCSAATCAYMGVLLMMMLPSMSMQLRLLMRLLAAGLSVEAPDASIAGWNSSSEQYTFAYLSDEEAGTTAAAGSSPVKLLVKVLVLDDTLLTTLATDKASSEPKVLELAVGDYIVGSSSGASEGEAAGAAAATAAAGSSTKAFKNLDQLVATVTSAMSQLVGAAASGDGSSSSQKKQKTETTAAAAGSSRAEQQQQQQQPDPDHDPLRIGPPRRPMRIGEVASCTAHAFACTDLPSHPCSQLCTGLGICASSMQFGGLLSICYSCRHLLVHTLFWHMVRCSS
jgi:hypothetical protein